MTRIFLPSFTFAKLAPWDSSFLQCLTSLFHPSFLSLIHGGLTLAQNFPSEPSLVYPEQFLLQTSILLLRFTTFRRSCPPICLALHLFSICCYPALGNYCKNHSGKAQHWNSNDKTIPEKRKTGMELLKKIRAEPTNLSAKKKNCC